MNAYFICKTNKAPLDYKCGESIYFSAALTRDGKAVPCAKFKYTVTGDDKSRYSGETNGESGAFSLTLRLDVPGCIRINATALDENGDPLPECDELCAGVGCELENALPYATMPDGFYEFWDKFKRDVYAVEPEELSRVPVDCTEYPDFDIYDVTVKCAGSADVRGILSIPKNAKINSLEAYVRYKGYGVVSAPIDPMPGKITLWINAHGIKNLQPQEYYDELAQGRLSRYGFDKTENSDPETTYFHDMMMRATQATRYVATLPESNGNVSVAGGSQGAFQAMTAMATNDNVKYADVFVPWICDIDADTLGRMAGDPPKGEAMRYYDQLMTAKRLAGRDVCVRITAGLGDDICPPTGVYNMYRNLPCKKSIMFCQNKSHLYEAPEHDSIEYTENQKRGCK